MHAAVLAAALVLGAVIAVCAVHAIVSGTVTIVVHPVAHVLGGNRGVATGKTFLRTYTPAGTDAVFVAHAAPGLHLF